MTLNGNGFEAYDLLMCVTCLPVAPIFFEFDPFFLEFGSFVRLSVTNVKFTTHHPNSFFLVVMLPLCFTTRRGKLHQKPIFSHCLVIF